MLGEFYVYTHSKPDGTIFYVGKGKGGRCHVMSRRNKYHRNIVEKYGAGNIIISKVIEFVSEGTAISEEIALIAKLRLDGLQLTNMTNGGDGMSGYIMPQATKEKLSFMNSGEKHPMYGTKRPQEVLDKMSKALKGRIISKETREKMSKSHAGENSRFWGKPLPLQTRLKISATLSGPDNPNRGIPRTLETKAKISKANSGENNGMFGVRGDKHPNYGKKYSEELKNKLSDAHRGVPLSENHKASLSIAQQARWDKFTDLKVRIRTKVINEFLIMQMVNQQVT